MTARPPGSPQRRARAGGFTLIEILVAMMIFLAGMTGVLALMSTALSLHRDGLVAGRTTRQLDAIVSRLEVELAAGVHTDPEESGLLNVEAARLGDDMVYAVTWILQPDGEGVLALLSVAGHQKDLKRSRPIAYLMSLAPRDEDAVAAWRARGRRGTSAAGR